MSWAGLVDAAVLGTGRAPRVAGHWAPLAGTGLDDTDDQTRLLHHAAALSRARRAGFRPPLCSERPAPAPAAPDGRPPVGPAAQRRLGDLLAAGQYDLVAEWLTHLAGRRPPDVLLPDLLTEAAGRPRLRASLSPALGPLAGWLAGFNEEWAWARETGPLPADPSLAWETGSGDERRALLGRLRAADPATGRDLVASTWAADPFRDRAAFVALLVTGLSLADEPIAEQALADRRAEVRRAGADLLARLPGSRYARRAAGRAAGAVRVERTAPRRRLRVTVPPAVTAELIADGIDGPAPDGAGSQAGLLRQLVAAAPAGTWAVHTGLDPAGLLALADHTDWAGALRDGWTAAAVRDSDPGWLVALLDQPPAGRRAAGQPTDQDLRLLAALPAGPREDWLISNPDSPLFWATLERLPAPWSVGLSDRVRAKLATLVRADHREHPRAALRLAALRLEPPVPPQAEAARPAASWDDLQATLTVRAAMRRELAEEPSP